MVRGVRIKDHWSEQRGFEMRSLIAGFVIAFLTLTLIGRLFYLQVSKHDYYAELSQGNRVRLEPIPAARGLILDRNGEVLASNQPAYQLELVREQVPDLDETLKKLAGIHLIELDDVDDIKRTIKGRRAFDSVPVRLRMSEEDIARFAVQRFEFPGVDLKARQTRLYPHNDLGVHALGYVAAISEADLQKIDQKLYNGTALIGKLGIEKAFESQLHGINGFREILVNAQGRSVEKVGGLEKGLRTKAPTPGEDLVLSIDMASQVAAETALGQQRGALIAIDPANGDVIAMTSRPGFDPNMFGRGLTRLEYSALNENIDKPLLDRALRSAYPPGSTVKPVMALAGLAYGVITPEQTRYCRGFFTLPRSSRRYRDWKKEGHGQVDMTKAIAQSCDVYFYGLADTLGIDRISSFLGHFGFGRPTGLDIGGEKPGILPSREWKARTYARKGDQVWFPGETVSVGIGQGYMNVTPIQLAHVAAIIASEGKTYRPRLVTGIRDPVTGQVHKIAPSEADKINVATKEQWDEIIRGMVAVTQPGGTGYGTMRGTPYTLGGKTGTAQVFTIKQNEKYNEKELNDRLYDHGWFICFAPAENPRIAIASFIENGKHGAAAAVVAKKVLDAYLLGPDGKLKDPLPGTPPASAPAVPAPTTALATPDTAAAPSAVGNASSTMTNASAPRATAAAATAMSNAPGPRVIGAAPVAETRSPRAADAAPPATRTRATAAANATPNTETTG
jgi:penicillin-binding protein 2